MKKGLYLFTISIILLFSFNVKALSTTWKTVNGDTYYYEDNQLVTGFKTIDDHIYYFNKKGLLQKNKMLKIDNEFYYARKNGSLITSDWFTLNKKTYYFGEDGKALKGYHTIDETLYYFYKKGAGLRKGFQKTPNDLYYSNKNGVVKTGWQTIDGNAYYFNEEAPYQALRGYQTIDDKLYYFYKGNYILRRGIHITKSGTYYSNSEGIVQSGWQNIDGNTYYFSEEYPHKALNGYQTIDDKLYYFYKGNSILRRGFHKTKKNLYYSNNEGVVQTGWQEIGGKKYYFYEKSPYKAAIGLKTIDDKNLFFNPSGQLVTGKQTVNGNVYYCTNEGEFIKVKYIPKYYSQKNKKWKKKLYGKYYFGGTGCVPTALAMAFQSILEKTVKPTEIGNYLYKNTNQFNRRLPGTSGKGIIYAAKHYNVKAVPITSKSMMKTYLNNGNILYAAMQNGKFATKDWNHAIIMYKLSGTKTYALDPLRDTNNGYVDISLIWKQKSQDKDDLTGGSAIYALLPND